MRIYTFDAKDPLHDNGRHLAIIRAGTLKAAEKKLARLTESKRPGRPLDWRLQVDQADYADIVFEDIES